MVRKECISMVEKRYVRWQIPEKQRENVDFGSRGLRGHFYCRYYGQIRQKAPQNHSASFLISNLWDSFPPKPNTSSFLDFLDSVDVIGRVHDSQPTKHTDMTCVLFLFVCTRLHLDIPMEINDVGQVCTRTGKFPYRILNRTLQKLLLFLLHLSFDAYQASQPACQPAAACQRASSQ